MVELARNELLRYGRHLSLPEVGYTGQQRLKVARVLLIGVGGLGSPVAMYLAAAGVGRIGLVDFDRVDLTNLQRQLVYTQHDVGRPKLDTAMERLGAINPHVQLIPHAGRFAVENAVAIAKEYDLVIDGTDNFPTRYLVNDTCVLLKKPLVYGSIFQFEGQATVFDATRGPCYRCLYPAPPPPGVAPSCAEAGVFGVLPGIIGTIQATEALKLILGTGATLLGRLLLFDALAMRFHELALPKNPDCPLCGDRPTITVLRQEVDVCGVGEWEITAHELKAQLDRGDSLQLIDVREPHEYQICRLAQAQHIPLAELPSRSSELDRDQEMVLYCHRGVRSLRALALLRAAGFRHVRSLHGGIDAWSTDVDQMMIRY